MRSPITFVPSDGRPSRGKPSASTPPDRAGHEKPQRHRILIVSGKRAERTQWADLLPAEEFLVSVADNGKVALRAIEGGGIDLVIAAVMMDMMDGIELVRSARLIKDAPPIIVVASSNTTIDRAYLRSAALAGAMATYTQPLRANEFLAGIQSALTLKRSPWTKP